MKKYILASLFCAFFVIDSYSQATFHHPWQGKKVAYFGDSITDPNVITGSNNNHFWNYLQSWLGITPYVYAVSGRQWDDIPRQAEQLQQEHKNDFDAIIIFMGTNDYNAGLPIGKWYQETTEDVYAATGEEMTLYNRKMRIPDMDGKTYCGRINIALNKIRRTFPDKQVVLLTPIHRGYAKFGNNNVQPVENFQNKCGLYLDSYVNATKEAGIVWAVPVIDLQTQCGLLPQYAEYAKFFKNSKTDMLHPNEAGHERMAKAIMYQLLTIGL